MPWSSVTQRATYDKPKRLQLIMMFSAAIPYVPPYGSNAFKEFLELVVKIDATSYVTAILSFPRCSFLVDMVRIAPYFEGLCQRSVRRRMKSDRAP